MTPEINRCARAIAGVLFPNTPWEELFENSRETCGKIAIACIEAVLPDFCEGKAGDIAEVNYDERADAHGLAQCNRGLLNGAFTAAIRAITREE